MVQELTSIPEHPSGRETVQSTILCRQRYCAVNDIVHAVNDIVPHPEENDLGEQKDPFMYWDAADAVNVASALIKRYVFVVVSFVIFILHEKSPLSRANKNMPLNKCRCYTFFWGHVTNKTYFMI